MCTFADFAPYAVGFSTLGFIAAVVCIAMLSRIEPAFGKLLTNGLLSQPASEEEPASEPEPAASPPARRRKIN
jgi:hypothetical protein